VALVQVGINGPDKWIAGEVSLWSAIVKGLVGMLSAQLGIARGALPAGRGGRNGVVHSMGG
jgi:hypothetical protein